jgi:hypothetical protein
LLPVVDEVASKAEVYDTGAHFSEPSKLSSLLVFMYNLLHLVFRFFDRFIKPEKAEEIAAGVYYLGMKQQ